MQIEKERQLHLPPPPASEPESAPQPRRRVLEKDWDRHVAHADQLASTAGFQRLRDRILEQAAPDGVRSAIDVGTGTGLLALPLSRRASTVWALDISPAMVRCVSDRAERAGLRNLRPLIGSATQLPLADRSVEVAVSNYCFHHLGPGGKREAISELFRVLAPGGRLVFGDMMFGWRPTSERDRRVVVSKARAMLRRGPAGLLRLLRNAIRVLTMRGERPAPPEWWRQALLEAGFVDVAIEPLAHEGGVAIARRPG